MLALDALRYCLVCRGAYLPSCDITRSGDEMSELQRVLEGILAEGIKQRRKRRIWQAAAALLVALILAFGCLQPFADHCLGDGAVFGGHTDNSVHESLTYVAVDVDPVDLQDALGGTD